MILNAIDNNILFNWLLKADESILLSGCSECSWVSFDGSNLPVLSVMSVVSSGVKCSPLVKSNPEFTLVSISKVSLLFPFWSPEVTVFRPWSGIFGESPWVSHLNNFVNAFSLVIGKAKSLKDTIGVAGNKVIVTDGTGSSHWVPCVSTFDDDVPKFVIGDAVGRMGRDWHTGDCFESLGWITRVNLGVVDVKLGKSFLKED